METIDISGKIKLLIKFGLILLLATAGAIGYGVFEHYHAFRELRIENAKVTGTMVSVRTLVNGKVSEFLFEDGDEVKAGDVIARLEISITEETIQQLENTVELARQNYEDLKQGQWVKVPVKRLRAVQTPVTTSTVCEGSSGSANLAALEERANRMKELFEMGAVSAVQRDAAIAAYENARNSSSSSSYYTENGISYETTYVEEIEYVDEFQTTPPAVLIGAENAVKQAELSLNVALQEAQETEIIAPVDGTIYYSTELEKDLKAGEVIAKVGDSSELWLVAEVSEEIFNKVPLGKLVSYTIDGNNLNGIVIEKIAPDPVEEVPTEENLDAENNSATENSTTESPAATENSNAENNSTTENAVTDNPTPTENSATAENSTAYNFFSWITTAYAEPANDESAETTAEPSTAESSATTENSTTENSTTENSAAENTPPQVSENQTDTPPDELRNDKFLLRVSLPEERNFECKPNSTTTLKIRL